MGRRAALSVTRAGCRAADAAVAAPVACLAPLAFTALAVLAGCAQAPLPAAGGGAPSNAAIPVATPPGPLYTLLHRPLHVPDGAIEVLRLHGEGAQIFRCEMQGGTLRWVYRLPEAELRDAGGQLAVRHGVNLSFEHVDGSRLLGEITDHVPSPTDNSLPWLLMTTRSYGKGVLADVHYVERIDTAGGMPASACDAAQLNQVLRVPFAANFVFLR